MAFVAFDLEMDGPQVLCAATWSRGVPSAPEQQHDDEHSRLWTRTDEQGKYVALEECDLVKLVEFLEGAASRGAALVSWGGTSSDWRVLHDRFSSAELKQRIKALTKAHVDIPLIACAASGMMMGLEASRQGMQIGAALRTLESAAVPGFWRSRELPLQTLVLQHVAEEAFHTAAIYSALLARGRAGALPTLTWVTRRRKLRSLTLQLSANFSGSSGSSSSTLPSVSECLTWAPPRTDFPIPPQFEVLAQTAWLRSTLY
jgi:hypothetical protein